MVSCKQRLLGASILQLPGFARERPGFAAGAECRLHKQRICGPGEWILCSTAYSDYSWIGHSVNTAAFIPAIGQSNL